MPCLLPVNDELTAPPTKLDTLFYYSIPSFFHWFVLDLVYKFLLIPFPVSYMNSFPVCPISSFLGSFSVFSSSFRFFSYFLLYVPSLTVSSWMLLSSFLIQFLMNCLWDRVARGFKYIYIKSFLHCYYQIVRPVVPLSFPHKTELLAWTLICTIHIIAQVC